jgi:NAD(P)-dependent dehydrogenase (short-subunit alcohol dehydrogenase family)
VTAVAMPPVVGLYTHSGYISPIWTLRARPALTEPAARVRVTTASFILTGRVRQQNAAERIRLDRRRALVTGAAGHVGRAITFAFVELGAAVAACDRDDDGLRALIIDACRDFPGSVTGLSVDLAKESETKELPAKAADCLGGLDILVNCAALKGGAVIHGWEADFAGQSADAWRLGLEVNLTAPFLLTQAAASFLRASAHGCVVNVASIYGVLGPDWRLYDGTRMGNPAAYAVSKGGLIQLTRWLATTLAPEIRVNCVSPGGIRRKQPADFVDRYESRTPLRRMGTEEEVADAVLFLASDLARYVTGQNLMVDGGWSAW